MKKKSKIGEYLDRKDTPKAEYIESNIFKEVLNNIPKSKKEEIDKNIEIANAIFDLFEEKSWTISNELASFLNGLHKLYK